MATRTPAPASAPAPSAERGYRVKGLQPADYMPINLHGDEFDLANLSEQDLAYLLGFPEEAPYLERLEANDNNQATGA